MKINKIDAVAKNTKHVGLLFVFLKFFLVFFFLNLFLRKGGFGLDNGLREGRKTPPGLPAGAGGLS